MRDECQHLAYEQAGGSTLAGIDERRIPPISTSRTSRPAVPASGGPCVSGGIIFSSAGHICLAAAYMDRLQCSFRISWEGWLPLLTFTSTEHLGMSRDH
jgi:hypothetical protein